MILIVIVPYPNQWSLYICSFINYSFPISCNFYFLSRSTTNSHMLRYHVQIRKPTKVHIFIFYVSNIFTVRSWTVDSENISSKRTLNNCGLIHHYGIRLRQWVLWTKILGILDYMSQNYSLRINSIPRLLILSSQANYLFES